ncbi:hypothetical protein BDR07DRAFT_907534 [Suillus spraguei]|nr:hypothetical protein BDR07DRAFT_907534 [Suillus spraguei]
MLWWPLLLLTVDCIYYHYRDSSPLLQCDISRRKSSAYYCNDLRVRPGIRHFLRPLGILSLFGTTFELASNRLALLDEGLNNDMRPLALEANTHCPRTSVAAIQVTFSRS